MILTYWRMNHTEEGLVVQKVGRKWATVGHPDNRWGTFQIDINTGEGKEKRKDFGADYKGWHPDDWADEQLRNEILSDVKGMLAKPSWHDKFYTHELAGIRDILKG